MKKFYLTVLILYLSNHLYQCSGNDDFVDPLDMLNYDRGTKSMKRPKTKSGHEPVQINDRCTVFLSRFINLLLKTTGLDNVDRQSNDDINEALELNSYASVTISVGDLRALKNMATKKDIEYEQIDRILNTMFAPIKKNDFPEFQQTNEFIGMNIEIKEILYWISIGCILICLLYTVYHYFFNLFSISSGIFIFFMLAFASTWYTMYMKAEISRSVHLEYMPTHCKKTEHWFSWLMNKPNLDECKAYKEAVHLNPMYSIAITEVFAEMLSKIMVKPIESLGEAVYSFNNSVFKDYPMWAKFIIVPIVIVIIIKTMLVSLALLVGRYVSMKSIFGYGSTTIGPEQTHSDRFTTSSKIDNNIRSTASGQHTFAQMPDIPKVNFNINFFHPSSDNMDNRIKCNNNQFKLNFKKNESNFISMLKNEDNDSVDNTSVNDLRLNKPRSRTLSI
ncbi:Hypothetical protein CINCED_3A021676 [Cinara cedri]|uniref:Chloride channel CLIC-like protein 1 n=1 Tax=Cinara cedri TaxID=506608 RepID=A0A5E4MVP6_9HEMI|nr:Hypothetical protein CINCED_3A021676 [Cinara cedri]